MKFVLFADDTNILCSGENLQQLLKDMTHEMNKLKSWFTTNKLSPNLNKTKLMLFGKRNTAIPVQITIDDVVIEKVEQNTFLGVIIDKTICWKPHIKHVCSKVAKSVGVMRRAGQILNNHSLLLLYHAFVLPYMSYCVEIWGNTYKTNLSPLVILQKRAIRSVYNKKYNEHTNHLFLRAASLKFPDLVNLSTAQIIYRAKNHTLPHNLQTFFSEREGCKRYDLRGANKLQQKGARTTLKSMCITIKGTSMWNGLSEEIKTSKNLKQFKRRYKKEILDLYNKEELLGK